MGNHSVHQWRVFVRVCQCVGRSVKEVPAECGHLVEQLSLCKVADLLVSNAGMPQSVRWTRASCSRQRYCITRQLRD